MVSQNKLTKLIVPHHTVFPFPEQKADFWCTDFFTWIQYQLHSFHTSLKDYRFLTVLLYFSRPFTGPTHSNHDPLICGTFDIKKRKSCMIRGTPASLRHQLYFISYEQGVIKRHKIALMRVASVGVMKNIFYLLVIHK